MSSSPAVFGTHQQNTLDQFAWVANESGAVRAALMADGHLGYLFPIGGVAAYRDQVPIAGVGFDIACGNCCIRTDLFTHQIEKNFSDLADEIQNSISFGIGRKNAASDAPVDHPLFDHEYWDALPYGVVASLRDKARAQLGTVGSGNHYVDVFSDTQGRVWVGVHFGSRGLGHTIASGFLALSAGQQWGAKVAEHYGLLDLDTQMGADYWALMSLAGEYAYAGREWVTRKVVALLGGQEMDLVHNHHNFAWRERHLVPSMEYVEGLPVGECAYEDELIVVRKGATPAFPEQRGFVGGSMGDCSVILRGFDCAAAGDYDPAAMQEAALYSTVHGAGRVMSRTEAAGKVNRRRVWRCGQRACGNTEPLGTEFLRGADGSLPRCPKCGGKMRKQQSGEQLREGKVSQPMMDEWLARVGVVLRGGGLDESPHAYRRLPDVLAAQGDTIVVEEVLTPLVVVMASRDEFDPYSD